MNKRNSKTTIFLILLVLSLLLNACSEGQEIYKIESPNSEVKLSLKELKGDLFYTLNWQNENIIDTSKLSIKPNAKIEIIKAELKSSDTTWKPTWGQFSEIRDYYNELILTVEIDKIKGKLLVRAYNGGVGFRFDLDDVKIDDQLNFYSEYNLSNTDILYYTTGGTQPKGPFKLNSLKNSNDKQKMGIPVVVEKSFKKYLSILESDLISTKGFQTMKIDFDKHTEKLISKSETNNQEGKVVTPWKVVLLGETAGDLVTSSVTLNLATPNKIENSDWIKPGKTLWDWRVHGYTASDGFKYGVNTESYKRFIDFAAEKKIEYFLIDANWYTKTNKGSFNIAKELDFQEVINYAAKKEVDLLLYYDRHKGDYGDDKLFSYFKSLDMKGIKYGFMGNNPDFSREAILKSVENKLLIDFHDSPVPFTGVQRTYPNAITREYCHAQQDYRKSFTPETFIKMALINAVQGPLDMNNGNFDLIGINKGDRQKGPKKTNSYFSTVTSEVARTLIIFSGLVCIPDAPESYEAKADLFEFIQKMPVGKWDESKVLNAAIGKNITTARRYGKEWFIGSVIDQKGGTLNIKLDFLEEGKDYEVTFYEDTAETHCKTNPEAYQIRKGIVKKGDLIKAILAPGGGHCMWIHPKIME
ncbi:glycoside hydrolase family 97 protein [Lutibacter sp. A80]|uniref:glycoside hydrolase family 97 protein n=1 Tax=Lutibacter sp. A80 TaxID=2918453 RepID=UPI001F068A71|nr:glycoside hydrolase family 97 protein [Lutibacter sp. A80]UMB62036.1 glycoside hydrolase family 97 protein [Lutibacter sp. A80]